jgi:hypothetical protein
MKASTYKSFSNTSGNPYAGEYIHSYTNPRTERIEKSPGCWSKFRTIIYPCYEESKVRNIIQQYLTSIDMSGLTQDSKYNLYFEMFSYIEENKIFLRRNRIFSEAIRCRLIDLGREGWGQASPIYRKLYGHNLPAERGVYIID